MTREATLLLIISGGLFAFFFLAIICSWFYSYFRELNTNKVRRQLVEMVSSYFKANHEIKPKVLERINAYVGRSAGRKDILIHVLIGYGPEFMDNNQEQLMEFYDAAGIKAFLIKGLHAKSDNRKSLACRYLGELKVKDTEPYILELISSKNNDVIYNVLLALSKLGDTKGFVQIFTHHSENINISSRAIIEVISVFNGSVEDLFKQTFDSSDDYIRGVLIKAAADYRIEGLRPYFVDHLKSDDKNIRIASIRALCELKDRDDERHIIPLLEDKDWEVRAAAAKELEKLGTSSSFTALEKTTGDRVWWVRHNAAKTLILIPGGKEYASRIIDGDDQYAREAIVSVIELM
ncbi:HEAT repeat domain-containing protein [Paenibacillus spongiae]|uniref:HEAT repeat domain-containing protein n=1 Tax=Paenibacillus spongiae TaxID=2909671 RepID=A0ABY5SFE5_9BACL|nr:HEAT repeat domain-containing protein [Paenibacillus spongiae]UVI30988.1 HEAT repeat domain-containing protein [Paenibacillus spongiae]